MEWKKVVNLPPLDHERKISRTWVLALRWHLHVAETETGKGRRLGRQDAAELSARQRQREEQG